MSPAPRDLTQPHHLPNLREGGGAPDPSWLPRQRRGITPQMIGRYPDYDVFDAADAWDDVTRRTIMQRLEPYGPLRFFSPAEEPALRAFCDTVTAQDREPRVPVAEMVDAKLADGKLDGYRYADMPEDGETWRLTLAGLDESAQEIAGAPFAGLEVARREAVIRRLAAGELQGGSWEQLNVSRAWKVCMRATLSEFYSHPWAWNEIGFGGPAYPRGFLRLGQGASVLEPWERPGATSEDPVRVVQGPGAR